MEMKGRVSFGFVFMAAFFAGLIIVNTGKGIVPESTDLLDENILKQVLSMELSGNALFCYLFLIRLRQVLIMVVMATTYLGAAFCIFYCIQFGITTGIFCGTVLLQYGFRGILFVLAGCLPHYVVYVPVFYGLLRWCEETSILIYKKKASALKGRMPHLFLIGVGLLIGCLLESYLNPLLLKAFVF